MAKKFYITHELTVEDVPSFIDAIMADLEKPSPEIGEGIRILWFLAATAAYFQDRIFPSWVMPECPRITVNKQPSNWAVPFFPVDDLRISAGTFDALPIYPEMHETTVHMDKFRLGFNVNDVFNGRWQIGLGFLYMGPPDEDEYEERTGLGRVYCWISED